MNVDPGSLLPMNSVLRNLRRAGWLVLLLLGARLTLTGADEPPVKWKADLLWIRDWPNLMAAEYERDLFDDRLVRVSKARRFPQVKLPAGILRAPVFDISAFMKEQGLKMPPGSHALYSPDAQLFYLESTASDVDLAGSFLSYGPSGNTYDNVDVSISLVSAAKTETLLEVKSMPFVWGQRMGFGSDGEGHMTLFIDPVLGLDGETIDATLLADIQMRGTSLKKEFAKKLSRSKPEDIEIGSLGDAVVTARLVTHGEGEYLGPALLETAARQAAAIAEIQKALHPAPAP